MSLSSRDQQALEAIEEELASDEELASMLAMFNRLAVGEAMPARGRGPGGYVSTSRSRCSARERVGQARTPAGRRGKLLMVLWVVVSVILVAVAAVISRGDAGPCAVPAAAACAGHQVPHVHQA